MKCVISFSRSFAAPTHPKKKLPEQMMPTKQHPAEVMIDNKIQASPPNQYHSIRLKKMGGGVVGSLHFNFSDFCSDIIQ
ncbi:hypothetical protein [Desulfobulbus propionicus]